MLRLHDTATGTVRPLELREEGRVSMYVCGPTVYDVPHLGHGRFTLVFDVLRRYLEFRGLEVRYVSNITDIDDHIITRASEEGRSEAEVAGEYEVVWWQAMDALGVKRPTEAPHATAFVEDMVGLIGALVDRGVAYETSDGVYLSVDRIEGYGLLARQSLESLRSGARVELGEEKRSPLDFVLWKKARPGEPTWASPWGAGRPGWHTECVVMSLDLLGEGFDLHGGGMDLAFPHHENERAQAVGLGRAFARHWVHNGWVMVEGEKMSKSLGNFTSLTDLLERADARAYRLLVLRAHYRSPIEVTPATVDQAEGALTRLDDLARRFDLPAPPAGVTAEGAGDAGADAAAVASFVGHMDDDLDTPGALAEIFDLARGAHQAAEAGDLDEGRRRALTVAVLCNALGLELGGSEPGLDVETTALVAERDGARASGSYDRADAIRRELEAKGWVVEDSAEGTRLHRRPGS
ncbi:MAG TPA: cysteine--tRNA ligase [Acidimicrobiales bacterium]|nr:cysteine--tRNA ligase [Acidimicrobiales bacterium]